MSAEATMTAANSSTSLDWGDRLLWVVVGLMILGEVARHLVSDEPFCKRKFAGELIFAALGGFLLWTFGLLQGLTAPQMLLAGGLGSLGGVRLVEWVIKIGKEVRRGS